ncbi:MAG: 30S ribosomal protein S16 [Patescibacteria group bacterium]
MVTIRLQRVGRKHDPAFRVVVVDRRRSTKTGNFLEIVGSHNARHGRPKLKPERLKYWLAHGAQPSTTVHNILVDQKIIPGPKINALPSRKKKPEEAKPATA